MKIALITGATSGIGKATAELFAKNSIHLILTGRRKDRLEELKNYLTKQYKIEVLTLCFDVQKYEQVSEFLSNIPTEWQKVDILVNNAGLAMGLGPMQEGLISDWDQMIDTNVKGLLYVTKHIAAWMIQNKTGHIVNISSIAGTQVYPNGNVYCASKHAVTALSKSMRIDLLPHGIKVTSISPGMVETEFSLVRFHGDAERANKTYEGITALTGHDIAETIWFAVSRSEHVVINDIELTTLMQANTRDLIRNKIQ